MLSNLFFRPHMDPSADGPFVYRPVRREETHDAVRLILAADGKLPGDAQVLDFLRFAVQRGINLPDLWVAERGGQLYWAVLPVVSPGRTMLLLVPPDPPANRNDVAAALTAEVCGHFAGRGMSLAQVLADPGSGIATVLTRRPAGFEPLAELAYLQTSVRRPPPVGDDGGLRWQTYDASTHGAFAAAVLATYVDSLDCPTLNGLRDIDDILAGHKAAGEFDPRLWFLLSDPTTVRPAAVLLLGPTAAAGTMELVYLGVAPSHRGRGLGGLLVRKALAATAESQLAKLSLAVDAQNAPALKLYYRHGLQRFCTKVALMRDLRPMRRPPEDALVPTTA